jgi:phosphate-selective porin OprO and OprP
MNISGCRVTASVLAAGLLIFSVFLHAKEEIFESLPALGKEKTASNTKNGIYFERSATGLKWESGASEIRINSLLQGSVQPSGSDAGSPVDQFFLRRTQPALDIKFERNYGFHMKPVLGTTSGILDAYLESNIIDSFRIRVGRFMPSFGRESLPSATASAFNERAFPINLGPIREIGGQIHGEVLERTAEYHLGVFGGRAVDGGGSGYSVAGYDSSVNFSARFSARPFHDSGTLAKGLGLGLVYDYQTQPGQTTPGNWVLPAFRSPGQRSFVSNSYDAYAGGGERIFPRVYYHNGPFGLLGEYMLSRSGMEASPATPKVGSDAFQVQFAWFVADGNKLFGKAMPGNPLDGRSAATAGAVQLLARYSQLGIDRNAFTNGLMSIDRSARNAKDFGVGLNWHLNRKTKLQLNYDQTSFEGGAPSNTDRPAEKVLSSRMQFAF